MRLRLGYVTDSAQLQCFYYFGREPWAYHAGYVHRKDARFLVYSDRGLVT